MARTGKKRNAKEAGIEKAGQKAPTQETKVNKKRTDEKTEEMLEGNVALEDQEPKNGDVAEDGEEEIEGKSDVVGSDALLGASQKRGTTRKVIIVLDEATLEVIKSSKGSFELLNCDDHLGMHKKLNKDPAMSRPDITHQMLLSVLDSPLNKAGHVEIFLRTNQNVLIKVSEHLRVPRTFKRFAGLMVQLLHKLKIRAKDGNETLMKVIKNPITAHLPVNARIFLASVTGTLVDVHEFVPALPDNDPYVFVFGAFAHGHVQADYAEAALAFSEYSLSGACALTRLLGAFERKWGII